ncbi:MAG: DUF2088 domain-containing protein [Deltaproteobacteria bacterium]|nr:DUF2088 domain-containing protein [Deltaproteobacteria bacterium]
MIGFAASGAEFPKFYRAVQRFDNSIIANVSAAVRREFGRLDLAPKVRTGQRVAVAVGSRGIHGLDKIVAGVVDCLKSMGLEPYIFPAMGSHGGATAAGQASLLRELGISETTVQAPIVSTMDVVSFGKLPSGCEVFFAEDALKADHVFVINRVKPHTAFRAEVESGLCKMLAVGCGKHRGAMAMHTHGLAANIVPAAECIIQRAGILGGLAVVENPLDRTHTMRLAIPDEFEAVDHELLVLARQLLPRIPIDKLDILVVDEIGKNVSGGGMDTNVIGFWRRDGGEREPDFRTLIVLDITRQSHGNALGIGMADMTTRRVFDQIDFEATYTNALTSGIWASARTPIVMPDDLSALTAAVSKVPEPVRARIVRIQNTLNLETIWVTSELLPELESRSDIQVDRRPLLPEFDLNGRFKPFPVEGT